MAKKKNSSLGDGTDSANGSPSATAQPSPTLPATPSAPKPKGKAAAQPPSTSALIICRNKHWRYISSFHGPWLQLPPEILETLANINYNTPRPRPIDPAVFYDMVKIRRLVDEATNLAVRAASGVANVNNQTTPRAHHHQLALGLGMGFGQAGQTKLSRERKFRMREQATQKLAKAYRLDEIACSVATMQSASSLEEVASLVLQRTANDADAKYVHFFHEKIPSRQLAECTSLDVLDEIIAGNPVQCEPLRTRATVRVFKDDYEGAVLDLTEALRIHRLYRPSHTAPKPSTPEVQTYEALAQQRGRKQDDLVLREEEQPSSLEIQLVFQRASAYLALACRHIESAFPDPLTLSEPHSPESESEPGDAAAPSAETMEARKLVRHNAKRALRDFTAFLSNFEYTPDMSIEIAEDFARKVGFAANGLRAPRPPQQGQKPASPGPGDDAATPHRVYALSDLFTAAPPSGLPPYPSTDLVVVRPQEDTPSPGSVRTTTEILTYHPLLTDALHSLLLCHCLMQTSAKELLRHAYMVARLARLADGYPVFQASRSPARADWIEVLRAANNWIQLSRTWEDLCSPAPLPLFQSSGHGSSPVPIPLNQPLPPRQPKSVPMITGPSAESSVSTESAEEVEKRRQERVNYQAMVGALSDDRVHDESSFRLAIRARQLRAERDYQLDNAVADLDSKMIKQETESRESDETSTAVVKVDSEGRIPGGADGALRRLAEERDYQVSTDRAFAVARWVLIAPPNAGGGDGPRRKKKKAGGGGKKKVSSFIHQSSVVTLASCSCPEGLKAQGNITVKN
ncbi:hypothetical protein QBC47DRAFT_420238 [Echria macrotheca]|uniref:Histidine kinase group protein n=1 Tax=Echria macrotheca TaxID=438768 RepID=A0AAJ0BJ45_9PEZI|nr:hypothetical protein QBC47DRAFT_420238 [Echria macrotheca]